MRRPRRQFFGCGAEPKTYPTRSRRRSVLVGLKPKLAVSRELYCLAVQHRVHNRECPIQYTRLFIYGVWQRPLCLAAGSAAAPKLRRRPVS